MFPLSRKLSRPQIATWSRVVLIVNVALVVWTISFFFLFLGIGDVRPATVLDLSSRVEAVDGKSPANLTLELPGGLSENNSYEASLVLSGEGLEQALVATNGTSLSLSGAGFTIDLPDPMALMPHQHLPRTNSWSIAPKSAGSHVLILRMDGASFSDFFSHYRLASWREASDASSVPRWRELTQGRSTAFIPARVVTAWGIMPEAEVRLKAALGFLAFLLSCSTGPALWRLFKGKVPSP